MCGIVGAVSKDAAEKVFLGLNALEYRGYDSWGIAFPNASAKQNAFYVEKRVGQISCAKNNFKKKSNIAIGHTRWATHGNVTKKNAHPHLSMDKKIVLVHNGIIENYYSLKQALSKKGYKFYSQTDSEVIANLIQDKLRREKKFEKAVMLALRELKGNYAVAVMHLGEQKLVCARRGSPLVVGVGKKEFFVGSDATAFISDTKKVHFLGEEKLVVLSKDAQVFDVVTGKKAAFRTETLKWDFTQAKKGKFPHFLIKEIFEQPETVKLALEQPVKKLKNFVSMLKKAKSIYLVGSGTSYHAALSASYRFDLVSKKLVTCCIASEFYRYKNLVNKDSLVVAISQSGETADLLEAIKNAKAKEAKICSIVNVMGSSVMRESKVSLLMNAGPEISVLSTKSYTSQITLLYLLAYSLAGKEKQWRASVSSCLKKLAQTIKNTKPIAKKIAKKLAKAEDIFIIGRHEAFPTALEAALKIKEVSYIHAEGYAGGELKHGPIALIEKGIPVIVISTPETHSEIVSNAVELKSRGATIIGIGSNTCRDFDHSIIVPDCGEANPIVQILPLQLIAYFVALEKKLDPDKPRNLAKSVTVK